MTYYHDATTRDTALPYTLVSARCPRHGEMLAQVERVPDTHACACGHPCLVRVTGRTMHPRAWNSTGYAVETQRRSAAGVRGSARGRRQSPTLKCTACGQQRPREEYATEGMAHRRGRCAACRRQRTSPVRGGARCPNCGVVREQAAFDGHHGRTKTCSTCRASWSRTHARRKAE